MEAQDCISHLQLQIPILDAHLEFHYISVTYMIAGVPAIFFKENF